MNLVVDQLNPQTVCLRLNGRLDLKGCGEIEQRFVALAATHGNNVIVDMAHLEFLASIGIRLLISSAKANARRGGHMVLAAPPAAVRSVLETAGIDTLIPLFADEAQALSSLSA
jgi:anti-anti-sigma factor